MPIPPCPSSSRDEPRTFVRWLFSQACEFVAGAASLKQLPPLEGLPEVAFVGRSNVGKSSLINTLMNRRNLARTSHTPGRTQQINFFLLARRIYFVDLPGYGYSKVSKSQMAEWIKLIEWYLKERKTLQRVMLLIDARHPLKESDQSAMHYLDAIAIPFQIVLTKTDKNQADPDLLASLTQGINHLRHAHPHIIWTSSKEKSGIDEVRASIAELVDTTENS